MTFAGEAVAGKLSLRVQQLDVRCDTKTKDNVFVRIIVSVQYQVREDNLYDAFYRLTNSSNQITSYVFDVVSCAGCFLVQCPGCFTAVLSVYAWGAFPSKGGR